MSEAAVWLWWEDISVIKKNRILFSGKRSEENNNFLDKSLAKYKKKNHRTLFFSACLPTHFFPPSSISIHSFFICQNESNLSMKNKFYIKGSQFFLYSQFSYHSSYFFFCCSKAHQKNFVIFYFIFIFLFFLLLLVH